ncbi:uncharacterized protein LOC105833161 isoform X2 [Monomorium pharaonis]|uniref:uncharacterized protein LOC105833161 isoform X2 n=1 Tax=Monomorium pharaonis TaxID=307658 RepID=UPI00102E1B47|nr:uncharacterized protein LOC105833161 isoform X2 [Monomorium pharaonis]
MLTRRVANRNIPYIVDRWPAVSSLLRVSCINGIHPALPLPSPIDLTDTEVDLSSGPMALRYGSRTPVEEGGPLVSCAIFVPHQDYSYKYRLNQYSSSFSAKSIAISRALEIVLENDWKELNICFDSKSNLEVIKSSEEVYRNTIIKLGWTE